MDECIFCKIIRGESPAEVVFEDERVIAFKAKDPIASGHTLVVPKVHSQDIFDSNPEDIAAVGRVSQLIARRLQQESSAVGINILHASGICAQQSVFHFHIHVVPRFPSDGLELWLERKNS